MNSPLKHGHQAATGVIAATRHIAWYLSWHTNAANAPHAAPRDAAPADTGAQKPPSTATAHARAR